MASVPGNDNGNNRIIEVSDDLIAVVDTESKILIITPHCKDIIGFEHSEIIGTSLFEIIHQNDRSYFLYTFNKAITTLCSHLVVSRIRHNDGTHIWFESKINPYRTEIGNICAVIILRDITDRQATEYELNALNNLMEAVHKSLDLQIVYDLALDTVINMDNIDMAMIYLVDNERRQAVLQAQRNIPDSYLQRASNIPYPLGITWKIINSGKTINFEDAMNHPDIGPAGRQLGHHSFLGVPIQSKDLPIGVIWFLSYKERKFNDREVKLLTALGNEIAFAIANAKMIKELRLTQDQLIQSEKLASAGQLISSIAHEINNPLTPILGYTEILQARSDTNEEIKKDLKMIHSSAVKVYNVIDKLLTFSRKHTSMKTPEDINDLIDKSLEFREYQLRIANIEVIRDSDLSLPKTLVDQYQLQQVFTNLIINAEQAIIDSGVTSGRLEIKTSLKNKDLIEISFANDGPSIDPKYIGKIFDPFFTTKEPGKGTGLGLSVSYGIIKEHGGEIYVKNSTNNNTCFIIDLPVIEKEDGKQLKRAEMKNENNNFKKKNVLIVEDEELISGLLERVIEKDNLVDVASNGMDALEKIESKEYDLIICDIKMPKYSGVQLYEKIKNHRPMLAERFLFITGDPSPETINFLNHLGLPFIVKPFTVDELLTHAKEIFN